MKRGGFKKRDRPMRATAKAKPLPKAAPRPARTCTKAAPMPPDEFPRAWHHPDAVVTFRGSTFTLSKCPNCRREIIG